MKKTLFFAVIMASLVISCDDKEIVRPKPGVQNTETSSPLTTKGSANGRVKDHYHSITSDGGIASIVSSFTPEELYISEDNALYAIDNSTGAGYVFNSDSPWTYAMASTNGYVYSVLNNVYFPANRWLEKINPSTGVYSDLTPGIYWPNTNILTAVGGYLYAVDGSTLWKINATTGSRATLGSRNWTGAEAMAALGSYVYIVDDGSLWRVNTSTGSASTFGTGSWSGIPAMAATGSYIYAVDDGQLWRVNVNTASIATFGNGTWNSTVAMTALSGYIYAVDAGQLWKVNTSSAVISLLTPPGYSWTGGNIEMAARQ